MPAWLSMLLPLLSKGALWLYERMAKNVRSTMAGSAVGVGVYEVLTTFGCDMSLIDPAVAGAIGAVPGLLTTDQFWTELWGIMKNEVARQKHSNAVLAEAEAAQAKAAKEAGISTGSQT